MNNSIEIITILNKFKNQNDLKLKGFEFRATELKQLQLINHQKIMNTSHEDVAENLRQYLFNNNAINQSELLFDKVNEVKEENLMIINLFIKYYKVLGEKTIVRESEDYISNKQKISILKLISDDMKSEDNFVYGALINAKIKKLESNRMTSELD